MQPKIVSVIGGRQCNAEVERIAHNLGIKLSKVANHLCCGGLGGVMMAVCRGFKHGKGVTIGILPGYSKKDANKYIDLAIPTGLGLARNLLVVKTGDVVVALPGAAGTLSEIAYCLQFGIPVISLNSWDIDGVIKVKTVDDAVKKVKELLR